MSRMLKCDKICKYVTISDKIFKNTTEITLIVFNCFRSIFKYFVTYFYIFTYFIAFQRS